MANYSLSEIDALCKKATRGAGYSWGMAEEVGKAVRWLSAYGFSGPSILSKHLELVADKHQSFIPNLKNTSSPEDIIEFANDDKPMCSIYCCMLINDLGHAVADQKTLSFHNMMFPLLAFASVGRIAEAYNISASFTYNETEIICNAQGIKVKDTPPLLSDFSIEESANVLCRVVKNNSKNTHCPAPQGRPIPAEDLIILEKFAHKTYAPATEESRLRGAG